MMRPLAGLRAATLWLFILSIEGPALFVEAALASPHPETYQQPDGSSTPELYLHGDEQYAWLSDKKGYTVIRDAQGWYVYAQKTADGDLVSSGTRVGRANPKKLGLAKQLLHDHAFAQQEEAELAKEKASASGLGHRRTEESLCTHVGTALNPCYLKQLAVLVKFKGHENRKLPSPEEIDVLFNHNGPTGTSTASTGSISDVYRSNSFDTFVLDTHVSPWQQISLTEEYASDGRRGFNHESTREAWRDAVVKYSNVVADGLGQFDDDGDGYIDALVLVHSGVAAESHGVDCEYGATFENRIWSHAASWNFLEDTALDVKVGRFYVFSGIHSNCPPNGPGTQWNTGRIAAAVHEAGHFLGLPDLYGKPGFSNGIGNFGFMANMYGWDASQNYPGLMSVYCRYRLRWVEVIDVDTSQEITVTASCDSDKAYRIRHRMSRDEEGQEFILLDNRYACGHDLRLLPLNKNIPHRQGIAIWHVDETNLLGDDVVRFNTYTAPDDPSWPGVHSRVSLLQSDGRFDMENNSNRGDSGDCFRIAPDSTSIAYKIDNNGVTMNNGDVHKYPNTNSIATGVELNTGIVIEVLDEPAYTMRVKITLFDKDGNSVTEYSKSPTESPSSAPTPTPVAASSFTCDNLPGDNFKIDSLASQPGVILFRKCQFIKPPRDPDEWCKMDDLMNPGKKVYERCQIQCGHITHCQGGA